MCRLAPPRRETKKKKIEATLGPKAAQQTPANMWRCWWLCFMFHHWRLIHWWFTNIHSASSQWFMAPIFTLQLTAAPDNVRNCSGSWASGSLDSFPAEVSGSHLIILIYLIWLYAMIRCQISSKLIKNSNAIPKWFKTYDLTWSLHVFIMPKSSKFYKTSPLHRASCPRPQRSPCAMPEAAPGPARAVPPRRSGAPALQRTCGFYRHIHCYSGQVISGPYWSISWHVKYLSRMCHWLVVGFASWKMMKVKLNASQFKRMEKNYKMLTKPPIRSQFSWLSWGIPKDPSVRGTPWSCPTHRLLGFATLAPQSGILRYSDIECMLS